MMIRKYNSEGYYDPTAYEALRKINTEDGELTIDCVLSPSQTGIPQGKRNSTMSRFAGRVVKRYGATERAYNIFLEESKNATLPLTMKN